MFYAIRIFIVTALLAVAGAAQWAARPEAPAHADATEAPAEPPVPLYDDLGDHGRTIRTSSERAQAYFDQGLRLQYAFNHPEAIRSYREALAADPGCAICWWGIALAAGPNINAPMTEEGGRTARRALREAVRLRDGAAPLERELIRALARRHADGPAADRAPLDSAYARAMGDLARKHPGDSDVLTLYAASLMNLSPWNYWEGEYRNRSPRPGTPEILETLEEALRLDPENPGACHYFIHAVEAAYPERALECAERLPVLMPGAGHIVHMPGHIYIRTGRYVDAVRTNEHAVHSDESVLSDQGGMGIYAGAYYPHNYHFMAFAATMAGMSEKALEASRAVAPKVPVDVAREVYWIQNAVVLPQLTLLTFGRWEEVLDEPLPPEELEQASILARYTRGVAYAALGEMERAEAILEEIRERAKTVEGEPSMNPIPHIAPLALAGEIALRSGWHGQAVQHFREAAEVEDALLYEEPPLWYYPIRHSLGRALLEAGRPEAAEEAYRTELERFPENGWSLFGLARSLEEQGRTAEAEEVRARFRAAWADADVSLTASRF